MQPFLERVVGHLERVQRVARRDVVDGGMPPDPAHFEAFLFTMLDQGFGRAPPRWARDPWYLRSFVEDLHWSLLDGAGASWRATARIELIEAALVVRSTNDGLLDLQRSNAPRSRLLATLIDDVIARIGDGEHDDPPLEWQAAPRYAERLGLTRTTPEGQSLAPAGEVLLRLRGVDRLRWLLALETRSASSGLDPWCIDMDSVRVLSTKTRWSMPYDERHKHWRVNPWSFARWLAFGALRDVGDEVSHALESHEIEITSVGSEIFGELAAEESTSFRTLARAFIEDQRDEILTSWTSEIGSPDRATLATLRHARMVAHEVRNALLPVQHALGKIFASPLGAASDLTEPRKRVEEGLARLHRFVDDSLRLTPIAAEEAATFSVMEAIEEARRRCDPSPGGGVLIEARPGSADPRCRGHRGRFVVALLNLLRNAVQVGGPDVRVEIGVDARTAGRVIISLSDDGPGIPEAHRATIFQNGVSYRDGGTGHGLSYVRLVVEDEMGGGVRVISSADESGACFELELPTEEVKT